MENLAGYALLILVYGLVALMAGAIIEFIANPGRVYTRYAQVKGIGYAVIAIAMLLTVLYLAGGLS
jgi:hypothetical protein